MTLTETDRTAADVAWDLEPLVDGRGAAGADALFDDANDAPATSPRRTRAASRRWTQASWPS